VRSLVYVFAAALLAGFSASGSVSAQAAQGAPETANPANAGQALPFENPSQSQADSPQNRETNYLGALPPDTVLAEINGQKITVADLNRIISYGDPDIQGVLGSDAAKRRLLQNYVESRAFFLQALEEKMDDDPRLREYIDMIRQQMYSSAWANKEREKITITEEELRAYYDENRKEFEIPESVNASHILVRTEAEAAEIKKQLDQGADFVELAREKSIDTTNKGNGGKMGIVQRGAMFPAFEDAAFKLKPGEISDPVQTNFGYHIIKVLEVNPRTVRPYEDIKGMIQSQLRSQKQNDWLKDKKEELRSKFQVKIYDQHFKAPPSAGGAAPGSSGQEAPPAAPPGGDLPVSP
jgi:peptidyl-prolyl cis-trans isomerase C